MRHCEAERFQRQREEFILLEAVTTPLGADELRLERRRVQRNGLAEQHIEILERDRRCVRFVEIGEDTGMVGAVWGIESCVEGLDRNWAYNPRCKMARP